jgi:GNAT superfamily N-acetyltransferase
VTEAETASPAMAMIRVRTALPEDAEVLAALVTDLGYPVDGAELWSRVQRMPSETYRTLVALVENQVAGFVGLLTLPVYEHPRPIGWILALCIAPNYRRRGIGTALINEAERLCRSEGVVDLRLHSGLKRDEAHEFYEKMGFDRSGYRFKKKL